MATLSPGMLLKLLENIGLDVKVAGAHRSVVLQVIGIVPALAGSDLWPLHGFYIKISDSAYATYVSLGEEHDDMILNNQLQLGQLIHVDNLQPGSPVPVLQGVKPIPGKHAFVGTPEDLLHADIRSFCQRGSGLAVSVRQSCPSFPKETVHDAFDPSFTENKATKRCERRASLGMGSNAGIILNQSNSASPPKDLSKLLHPSTPRPYRSPANVLIGTQLQAGSSRSKERASPAMLAGRRSVERPLWSTVFEKDEVSRLKGNSLRSKIFSDSSPMTNARSVPASPAKDSRVCNSLFVEKDLTKRSKVVSSPEVGKSYQKNAGNEHFLKGRKASLTVRKVASTTRIGSRIGSTDIDKCRNFGICTHKLRTNDLLMTGDTNLGRSWEGALIEKDSKEATKGNERSVARKRPTKLPAAETLVTLPLQADLCPCPCLNLKSAEIELWDNLPISLATMGKEAIERRLAVSQVAVEALQEAAATESIVQSLRAFSELCSTSKSHNPQSSMDKFLKFHQTLVQVASLVEVLVQRRFPERCTSIEVSDGNDMLETAKKISDEQRHDAASWIDAALSAGLTSFSLLSKPVKNSVIMNSPLGHGPPATERSGEKLVESDVASNLHSEASAMNLWTPLRQPLCPALRFCGNINQLQKESFSNSESKADKKSEALKHSSLGLCKQSKSGIAATQRKADVLPATPRKTDGFNENILSKISPFPSVKRTGGILEPKAAGLLQTLKLAKQLQEEAETWFLKFMEGALDAGFKSAIKDGKIPVDSKAVCVESNIGIASVLSDLKRVNEWFDILTLQRSLSPVFKEKVGRIKQKLYEFLIQLCLQNR